MRRKRIRGDDVDMFFLKISQSRDHYLYLCIWLKELVLPTLTPQARPEQQSTSLQFQQTCFQLLFTRTMRFSSGLKCLENFISDGQLLINYYIPVILRN